MYKLSVTGIRHMNCLVGGRARGLRRGACAVRRRRRRNLPRALRRGVPSCRAICTAIRRLARWNSFHSRLIVWLVTPPYIVVRRYTRVVVSRRLVTPSGFIVRTDYVVTGAFASPSYGVEPVRVYRDRFWNRHLLRWVVYFLWARDRVSFRCVIRSGSGCMEVWIRGMCWSRSCRSRFAGQGGVGCEVTGVPVRAPRSAHGRPGAAGTGPAFHSAGRHWF